MAVRSLHGAVVAVIGATGGLGSALCRQLVERRAALIIAGPHPERLQALAESLDGGAVTMAPCDLRDARSGDAIVAAASALGRLDGLINAAGVVAFGPLLDMPDELVEELFLINTLGPLWVTKRVAPLLATSKGFVLNISAVVAETPLPSMVAYSASKAGLTAADAGLTREFRRLGITVCDARPPHTETGLASRSISGEAPRFPQGLTADHVASVMMQAIETGLTEVPSVMFG